MKVPGAKEHYLSASKRDALSRERTTSLVNRFRTARLFRRPKRTSIALCANGAMFIPYIAVFASEPVASRPVLAAAIWPCSLPATRRFSQSLSRIILNLGPASFVRLKSMLRPGCRAIFISATPWQFNFVVACGYRRNPFRP